MRIESYIYSQLQNTSVAPRFLAHLTDNKSRVIGYILEAVPSRAAGIADLDLCRRVLQELHNLGIAHGNLSRSAFLISKDHPNAKLQFFHMAHEATDQVSLDTEMSSLEKVLSEPFSKLSTVVSEDLTAIQERDGYIHPALFMLLEQDGRVDVSEEDHRHLLVELEESNWNWTKQDVEATVKRLREKGTKLSQF